MTLGIEGEAAEEPVLWSGKVTARVFIRIVEQLSNIRNVIRIEALKVAFR